MAKSYTVSLSLPDAHAINPVDAVRQFIVDATQTPELYCYEVTDDQGVVTQVDLSGNDAKTWREFVRIKSMDETDYYDELYGES